MNKETKLTNKASSDDEIFQRVTFLLENETYGINKEVLDYCSDIEGFAIISIPQLGILRSLNVSNSASIVLWEYYKQTLMAEDIRFKLDL